MLVGRTTPGDGRVVQHAVEIGRQLGNLCGREHAGEDVETGTVVGIEDVLSEVSVFVKTHRSAVAERLGTRATSLAIGLPLRRAARLIHVRL